MVSFLYRMPAGIAGEVSRSDQLNIEPQTITAVGVSGSPGAYGIPVILDGSTKLIRALLADNLAADIYGWLVRPYPTNSSESGLGVAVPMNKAGSACDVLRRGYMSVLLARGTAAKGNPVYVRRVADTGKLVGDLEAALDNTIEAAAAGGNTGNATIGSLTVSDAAQTGVYVVRHTAATVFTVTGPDGRMLRDGVTGVAYSSDIGFTVTAGGTPMVAGDSFNVTVVQRTQAIPGARFMGPADANGLVEISYQIGA
jgi:hypothetical protein